MTVGGFDRRAIKHEDQQQRGEHTSELRVFALNAAVVLNVHDICLC